VDITQANLDIIFRAADNRFQSALTKTPTLSGEIATPIPMSTRQLVQGWLDRIPMLREWKGNRVINNAVTHARPIIAKPYENTVALSKWDVLDDQLGLFSAAVQMLAESSAKNPDKLGFEFLQEASVLEGYDGEPVYSETHPLLGGIDGPIPVGAPATQSNLLLETDLTWDNYAAARARMLSLKGADGAPMMVSPTVLMVSPEYEPRAKQILESDFRPDILGNAQAPQTNTMKGTAKILVNPWLAGDWHENWYLLDTSAAVKPFAHYTLTAPLFTYLTNPGDPNVFKAAQFLYGVEQREAYSETVWWLSLAATPNPAYVPA
jgi:phage major head subunit gpT-like protein